MSSQYRTSLKILCVGAPTTDYQDKRRKCGCSINVECSSWQVRRQYHEIREKIQPQGWRNIKTLGKRFWLCPSCVKFVMKKREDCKRKWG